MKSEHQKRVEEFMEKAGQEVPQVPTVPSAEVRELRAKLILEEAFETVEALGVFVSPFNWAIDSPVRFSDLKLNATGNFDLVEIADGCADIRVVTTGTLSACGIADDPLQEEVDNNNLSKFKLPRCPECGKDKSQHSSVDRPSEYTCRCAPRVISIGPYRDSSGKWIKGPEWRPPDIQWILSKQTLPGGGVCTCHERDSSYTCDYCKSQGFFGHMEKHLKVDWLRKRILDDSTDPKEKEEHLRAFADLAADSVYENPKTEDGEPYRRTMERELERRRAEDDGPNYEQEDPAVIEAAKKIGQSRTMADLGSHLRDLNEVLQGSDRMRAKIREEAGRRIAEKAENEALGLEDAVGSFAVASSSSQEKAFCGKCRTPFSDEVRRRVESNRAEYANYVFACPNCRAEISTPDQLICLD